MEGSALHLSHIDGDRRKFKGILDVPFRSWSSVSTVGELEKEVAAQTGQRVVYIAYRGIRLAKETSLSSLILDLQDESYPRVSVHTTSGNNLFFVRSLRGNSVMVDIPLDTSTVQELKEEVEALEKIPCEQQRFLYNGKHFADTQPATKTLHEYGVKRDSTVELLARMLGGSGSDVRVPVVEFADLQNQSALTVLPWSKSAPVWRVVGNGLNLEGKCTNEACIAHGHYVVCRKGFVPVNLTKEQGECPICKQAVLVKTCSFTSCTWMYEGRKVVANSVLPLPKRAPHQHGMVSELKAYLLKCFGAKSSATKREKSYPAVEKSTSVTRDIISPWFKASNQYEYFKQDNNMTMWENLLIVAKKCPTVSKDAPGAAVPLGEPCSICFQKFGTGSDSSVSKNHTTSCGHTFHAVCVESWLSCGGTTCPVCRVNLVV